LITRVPNRPSWSFGLIQYASAAVLLGAAAFSHLLWLMRFSMPGVHLSAAIHPALFVALVAVVFVAMVGTTALAARLTHWEATYRGLRLPLAVVRRGLDYHSVHYLPVAIISAITVVGYETLQLRGHISIDHDTTFLYVISAEVIGAAAYLFVTYWIAMRNMMYANR
jgi:hypothetical protein